MSVVDDRGREISYPDQAAPPGSIGKRAEQLATENDAGMRERMAQFLLNRARTYKETLHDGVSLSEWHRYRSVSGTMLGRIGWTSVNAREIGTLRQIRVYRSTTNTSSNGLAITGQRRVLVYRYIDGDGGGNDP